MAGAQVVLSLVTKFPAGSLITGNQRFRSLWFARLLSFFGDSVGLIALLLYTAAVREALARPFNRHRLARRSFAVVGVWHVYVRQRSDDHGSTVATGEHHHPWRA